MSVIVLGSGQVFQSFPVAAVSMAVWLSEGQPGVCGLQSCQLAFLLEKKKDVYIHILYTTLILDVLYFWLNFFQRFTYIMLI